MYLFHLIFDKQEFPQDHPVYDLLNGGVELSEHFAAAHGINVQRYKKVLKAYIEKNDLHDQFKIGRADAHYDYSIIDIVTKNEDSLMELVDDAGLFNHLSNIWVPKPADKGSFQRRI